MNRPLTDVEELQVENERLRNTVQALIQCNRLLLDGMGLWTEPRIPNN